MEIEKILKDRNIENVLHFTRAKNLESILKHGLLPRDLLKVKNIDASINDLERKDNLLNATSVSIEFPNYKMLLKLRQENPSEEWAIIFISRQVLLDKKCVFCYENAASDEMLNIPLEKKISIEMFNKMFEDISDKPTRVQRRLKKYYTTSPQAEILIFGVIEPLYFEKVVFLNSKEKLKFERFIPNEIKSEVIPNYFYAREDFKFDLTEDKDCEIKKRVN